MSKLALPREAKGEHRVGRVARWKLTDPIRLYLWPVAVILLLPAAAAAVEGAWWIMASVLSGTVTVVTAGECARASCYSPAGTMRALQEALRARE